MATFQKQLKWHFVLSINGLSTLFSAVHGINHTLCGPDTCVRIVMLKGNNQELVESLEAHLGEEQDRIAKMCTPSARPVP